MKKLNIDLSPWIPIGYSAEKEKEYLGFGLTASVILSVIAFAINVSYQRDKLFTEAYYGGKRILIENAKMADFRDCLGLSVYIFFVIIAAMAVLAFYHYNSHFQGSKSIYLMKRLPDRWEFARRCFAVPIAVTLLTVIIVLLLIIIYYQIYLAITPKACLVPGQWHRLWSFSRV